MIDTTTVIRRNPRAEFRSLGDAEGGVVLHLDTAAYHGLNTVGALIWNLADGRTFQEIVDEVKRQVDDAPPTLEQEIEDFIRALRERDLLVAGQTQNA
jgi:hypothetical protein